jgi:predicted CXXCH cytochrome family protein
MQPATDATVLGDFRDASFEGWRFFRRGQAFMVSVEGTDYEVAYTFGVDPLQQYLVRFPRGRLQAVSVAWDVRARRWFSLSPDVSPTDWLHWTRPGQCWNSMCADCHSTRVEKKYDAAADSFATTFSEVSVGCEACHGAGSRHLAWAASPTADASLGLVARPPSRGPEQVERCAVCHARRAQLADQGAPDRPLMDRYVPALLEPGLYHADGQILEEDFEYQSFLQSKMYAHGVACGDCHDVHSGALRAAGNALCTRCHDARRFDQVAHHGHSSGAGASCVACHMPSKRFMIVHTRRDHSLRVPQPEMTEAIGAPNACAADGCHAGQPAAWIASQYARLFGQRPRAREPHWGTLAAAGRRGDGSATGPLAAIASDSSRPAIVRASVIQLLGADSEPERAAFAAALAAPEPMLRYAAVSRFSPTDPERLAAAIAPLLADPIRAIRIAAATRSTELPPTVRSALPQAALEAALAETVDSLGYMSDLPSGPLHLGNLYASSGRLDDAERAYRRALEIDGRFTPAKLSLAQLAAAGHRLADAEATLRTVHADDPGFADAALDLGLVLAEDGKLDEAEAALRASLAADPTRASALYNLATLIAKRRPDEAVSLFRRAAALSPNEPRYASALAYALAQRVEVEKHK